jgi:hypothetical protein
MVGLFGIRNLIIHGTIRFDGEHFVLPLESSLCLKSLVFTLLDQIKRFTLHPKSQIDKATHHSFTSKLSSRVPREPEWRYAPRKRGRRSCYHLVECKLVCLGSCSASVRATNCTGRTQLKLTSRRRIIIVSSIQTGIKGMRHGLHCWKVKLPDPSGADPIPSD